MAVGMIVQCKVCDKTYDEGRTSHWMDCDGGATKRRRQEALEEFRAMSTEKKFEFLYECISRLKYQVANMPRGEFLIG